MSRTTAVFADLRRGDTALAGGKGANLGELTNGGLPVPDGFVVTSDAYLAAMDEARCARRAPPGVPPSARGTPTIRPRSPRALTVCGSSWRRRGSRGTSPTTSLDALGELGGGAVAVRSSATAEDTAGTSFAGMHDTYANVLGEDDVLARIVDCWRSLYNERVIAYRASRGLTDEPAIAVVVQDMAPAEQGGGDVQRRSDHRRP